MSFGSGSTKNLALPEPKQAGLDEKRIGTNEFGRPVPVLYGQRRLGLTFLTNAFDVTREDVEKEGGPSSPDMVVGRNIFASFAGLVCCGPVDRLVKILFDGEEVWPKDGSNGVARPTESDKVLAIDVLSPGHDYVQATTSLVIDGALAVAIVKDGRIVGARVTDSGSGFSPGSPPTVTVNSPTGSGAVLVARVGALPYYPITLESGVYRFYWGTEEQQSDDLLLSLSADPAWNTNSDHQVAEGNAPEEHGAYTGQAYLVAQRHFLGYNRNNLQNIELIVAKYPLYAELALSAEMEGDCAVAHIIQDIWVNERFGLGLPVEYRDEDGFGTFADILLDEGLALSPVFTRTQPFREALVQILENVDGYYSVRTISPSPSEGPAGLFTLGLFRTVGCTDGEPPELPAFDETCLLSPPKLKVEGWESTVNDIAVTFTNKDNGYQDDAAPGRDPANFAITGEQNHLTLSRPMITRSWVAAAVAMNAAKVLSLPKTTGRLQIRQSRLQGLQVGAPFRLHWDHYGICNLRCRALEISYPNPYRPEVEVQFEVDRSQSVELSYEPPPFIAPTVVAPTNGAIEHQRVIELPYNKDSGEKPAAVFLAAKPNKLSAGFKVWAVEKNQSLKTITRFCMRGTLTEDYSATATGVLKFQLVGLDTSVPDSVTEADANNNKWLLIVGEEIMAPYDFYNLGDTTWRVSVKREKFDTAKEAHTTGDEVWLLPLRALADCSVKYGWDAPAGSTTTFKLLPTTGGSALEASDPSVIPMVLTWSARAELHWKPVSLAGPVTFDASGDVVFTFTPNNRELEAYKTDANGPHHEIEIRRLTDPDDYPAGGYALKDDRNPLFDSYTVQMSELREWLGIGPSDPPESFIFRIYTARGLKNSRTYTELTCTKV